MKKTLGSIALVSVLAATGCQRSDPDPIVESSPVPVNKIGKPLANPAGRLEDDTLEAPLPKSQGNPSVSPATVGKSPSPHSSGAFSGGPGMTPRRAVRRVGGNMAPEKPKADETVAGSYEFGGQKVEIDGICSISESDISCWDMKGQKNSDLENRIDAAIQKQEEYNPSGISTSIRLGRKNRIIVVKNTRSQGSTISNGQHEAYRGLNVQSVGSSMYGQGYAGFSLENPKRDFDDSEYVSYEVLMTAEKPDVRETTLRLNQVEAMVDMAQMDCKVGAKTEFAGYALSIISIAKGPPKSMGFAQQDRRPMWTLRLKRSGSPAKQANLSVFPVDADGKPLSYVDEKGVPISMEEYGKQMRARMEKQRNNGPQMSYPGFGGAVGGMIMDREGVLEVMLLADPKRIPKIRISGTYNKLVDVTGIPLDPSK